MTPAITSGTASEAPRRRGPPRPPGGGGKLNVHAFASRATLPALISVNGEKRVPARSWSYVRHSCAGVAGRCALPATPSPRMRSAADLVIRTASAAQTLYIDSGPAGDTHGAGAAQTTPVAPTSPA